MRRLILSGSNGGTRSMMRLGAMALVALSVTACKHTRDPIMTGSIGDDYRQRHPITVQEKERTVEVFVGTARGSLTSTQEHEVMALAGIWRREATGGFIVDVPTQGRNAAAAAVALREIRGLLHAGGVPARSIVVRSYRPLSNAQFATIRLSYARITADAGPCGQWPEDVGPSAGRSYMENRQYWNFGCATQRNLAAMVAEPADLVQPRAESPAYAQRRTTVLGKYAKGEATATQNPDADQAKISELGK